MTTAEAFARQAHAEQVESFNVGTPYVEHLQRVADLVTTETEKEVAWLHDVLEDTKVTVDDLRRAFSPEVVVAVVLLSRLVPYDQSRWYDKYIARLAASGNRLAITVKIADLKDHLRPGVVIPEKYTARYSVALELLQQAALQVKG